VGVKGMNFSVPRMVLVLNVFFKNLFIGVIQLPGLIRVGWDFHEKPGFFGTLTSLILIKSN